MKKMTKWSVIVFAAPLCWAAAHTSPLGGVGDIYKSGQSPHMSRGFLDLPAAGPPVGERLNEAAYEFTRYKYPHIADSDGQFRPLAWCFGWRGDCGKNVADAFCKSMDPSRPVSSRFYQAQGLGAVRAPVVIGTLEICDAKSCSGFSGIDCVAEGQGSGRQPRRGDRSPPRPNGN